MSARSKKPTSQGQPPPFTDDNKKTVVFDSNKGKKSGSQYAEPDPTVVDGPLGGAKMHDKPAPNAGPTVREKPRPVAGPTVLEKPRPPVVAVSKKEQSAPIQAISMKTPSEQKAPEPEKTPILARPKLRAVSEAMPAQTPQNLGNLAQPYNPKDARSRAMREYVIWGCVAVILASAIALVVWFVAR